MEKSENTQAEHVENLESTIASRIKQLVELRRNVDRSDKELRYWRTQTSKLLESNDNIETNYAKLMEKLSDIDAKILENTKVHVIKQQELKEFKSARASTSYKQRNDCLSDAANYANNFSEWITEYSKNVLLKDIEDHRKECRKIDNELTVLKEEIDTMRRECDSEYVGADVDVDDLANLDRVTFDVKSSNSNLMHIIKLTEDKLNKIQMKIKQSKLEVNKYKTKEKNNIF